MSENNLRVWNALSKTDPKHTKGFKRSGGFTGTAIKPIYTTLKMTEVFGPAGEGWGTGKPAFEVVQGHNSEVLVYCTVGLWTKNGDDPDNWVFGVGGDKVVSHIKANEQYNRPERWENDDEAFKKAFTDAVGNAMKHLGMSADVHMGLFDDSKYVREREEEERPQRSVASTPRVAANPILIEGENTGTGQPPNGGVAPTGAKSTAQRGLYDRLSKANRELKTIAEFNDFWDHKATQAAYWGFPTDWKNTLDAEKRDKEAELSERAKASVPPEATLDKIAAGQDGYEK